MNKKKSPRALFTVLLWALLIVLTIYMIVGGNGKKIEEISLPSFLKLVEEGRVSVVREELGSGHYFGLYNPTLLNADSLPAKADFSFTASEEEFTRDLALLLSKQQGVEASAISTADYPFLYVVAQPTEPSLFMQLLPELLLIAAMLFFMWWFMRGQMNGNKQMNEFSKARAREMSQSKNPVTFADVAGADEEKEELQEIVEFLRAPQRFSDLGARIPKGVLLVGPPGTGKTLLAKSVAGEAKVPFFSISGSDFVEMFVGVGASRVRDLFNTAKRNTPSIVFIDEIDAVGRQRGAGLGGGHDEREQTLNQLLVEMDGMSPNQGVIIIAATNRPDILDPALLRPGRFDRQVTVGYPDVKGREAILKVHARNKKFEPQVDLKVLAQRTPGFTGADLENVLNEAAILTARADKKAITMAELEEAVTRVQMGPEKKSRVVTEEDRKTTAYHEAGHAVLALSLPKCDKLHEVSIISRGRAAGYTMTRPSDDWAHVTKARLEDYICMSMGGRVTEELVFGDISTGASQDIKSYTQTARKMVEQYGMSDTLGPIFFGGETEVFIARDWGHTKEHSEAVAAQIDKEVADIIHTQYKRAKDILESNREGLDRVSQLLLRYERVSGEAFERVFKGEDMDAVMNSLQNEAQTDTATGVPETEEKEASALTE